MVKYINRRNTDAFKWDKLDRDFSKDNLEEENYNAIKSAKDELVEYSKQAIEIIGNFSSKTWSNVKNKVKNWYEEFRNN